MLRSLLHALPAALALGTLPGCITDHVDVGAPVAGGLALPTDPAPGHELHRMFADEKRRAAEAELPAQF